MKIVKKSSPHKDVTEVILFTENLTEDFITNHVINLVENSEDTSDAILARKYTQLPESILVSDRQCTIATPIKFKKEVAHEQNRATRGSAFRTNREGLLIVKS
jgi:hypothetical protein